MKANHYKDVNSSVYTEIIDAILVSPKMKLLLLVVMFIGSCTVSSAVARSATRIWDCPNATSTRSKLKCTRSRHHLSINGDVLLLITPALANSVVGGLGIDWIFHSRYHLTFGSRVIVGQGWQTYGDLPKPTDKGFGFVVQPLVGFHTGAQKLYQVSGGASKRGCIAEYDSLKSRSHVFGIQGLVMYAPSGLRWGAHFVWSFDIATQNRNGRYSTNNERITGKLTALRFASHVSFGYINGFGPGGCIGIDAILNLANLGFSLGFYSGNDIALLGRFTLGYAF